MQQSPLQSLTRYVLTTLFTKVPGTDKCVFCFWLLAIFDYHLYLIFLDTIPQYCIFFPYSK